VKASIRFTVALGPAVLAATALVTGCASTAAPPLAATSGFRATGLAFRYPETWRTGKWGR
jgi:hypothetical protein